MRGRKSDYLGEPIAKESLSTDFLLNCSLLEYELCDFSIDKGTVSDSLFSYPFNSVLTCDKL